MVKLSQKSKRIPAKRRYTIEKRIRNHNKKVKKETKKNPKEKSKGNKIQIPNKFPFKEQLLQQAEQMKAQKLKEKEERKLKAQENKSKTIDEVIQKAEKSQLDFNNNAKMSKNVSNEADDVENSAKTFYKEFKKIIELSDVIIEVLDARDPLGTRCTQVEQLVQTNGKNKRLILLLNKIDLVPKENTQAWLKYLRNEYPTVAFKAATQNQKDRISQIKMPVEYADEKLLNSSKCLGADILIKLLKNYCRTSDMKQMVTVGIVGLPNTGKSSIINSLKRSQACLIGSTPGLTRHVQEVKLDKNIKLLDSPGIVISKEGDSASLVLKNCVRIEQLDDPVKPCDLIIKKVKRDNLMVHYKISFFNDVMEFLSLLAIRTGKLKKGGIPDVNKAAQQVLMDWNNGKLPYFTSPPEQQHIIDTQIVAQFSKAFDIDSILLEEQKLFESIGHTKLDVEAMELEPSNPEVVNMEEIV